MIKIILWIFIKELQVISTFFNHDNDLKKQLKIIERLLCAKHYAKYIIGITSLSLFKESHLILRRQIPQHCQKIGIYSLPVTNGNQTIIDQEMLEICVGLYSSLSFSAAPRNMNTWMAELINVILLPILCPRQHWMLGNAKDYKIFPNFNLCVYVWMEEWLNVGVGVYVRKWSGKKKINSTAATKKTVGPKPKISHVNFSVF